jgi:hypothetical protein
MTSRISFGKSIAIVAIAASACSQQPPAPAPVPPPVGRYQIATVAEPGDRSTTVILLDTNTGESWYFHQPVGQLFNGFWGNIPKTITPDATWSQAFQSLLQPPNTNRPAR